MNTRRITRQRCDFYPNRAKRPKPAYWLPLKVCNNSYTILKFMLFIFIRQYVCNNELPTVQNTNQEEIFDTTKIVKEFSQILFVLYILLL